MANRYCKCEAHSYYEWEKGENKCSDCGKMISKYLIKNKINMNTHGGARKNAGVKPKPFEKQRQPIHLTVYAENEKIDNKGFDTLKEIAKQAGQKAIDKTK